MGDKYYNSTCKHLHRMSLGYLAHTTFHFFSYELRVQSLSNVKVNMANKLL
jgi:hypothetical protein